MLSWEMLPPEIRNQILQNVSKDFRGHDHGNARAAYACVSKEWQLFFEHDNFQHLVLDQSRVADFEKYVTKPRQSYLSHIYFHVSLIEYDCAVCHEQEHGLATTINSRVFAGAVRRLLDLLSRIQRASTCPGITLELGASSPSDYDHVLDHPAFDVPCLEEGAHDLPDGCQDCPRRTKTLRLERVSVDDVSAHDPSHGWDEGIWQWENVATGAGLRLVSTLYPHEPGFSAEPLPKASAVTGFVIRRPCFRRICPQYLSEMISSFPSLEWFRHEFWSFRGFSNQEHYVAAHARLISHPWPSKLKSLYTFLSLSGPVPNWHPPDPDWQFSMLLSRNTISLENLCASFNVEASDFFVRFWSAHGPLPGLTPPNWPNLRTLALTSSYLHPHCRQHQFSLLQAAARAADHMPCLEVMELWHGGVTEVGKHGYGCFFRYNRANAADRPQITMASSWTVSRRKFESVVSAWRGLRRHRTDPGSLQVVFVSLPGKRHQGYAVTLVRLQLRHKIVDRATLRQIMWEQTSGRPR